MQGEDTGLDPVQVGEPPPEPQSLRDLRAGLAGAVGAAAIVDPTAIRRSAFGPCAVLGLPQAVGGVRLGAEHGGPA